MMKITVPTPQTRYNAAQTIVYWMPFALFGETADLFVVGGSDPWYCSSNLTHGLMHWNNPSKLSVSAKPKKLVELIKFQINDDIDIGSEEDPDAEESEESEAEGGATILAKSNALKVGLPNAPINASSSLSMSMASSNSPSMGSSSSSSSSVLSFSGQPAKVSPLAKNATTTLAMPSKPMEDPKKKTSKQDPKKNTETKKRQREVSDSDSEDDQDLEDEEAEDVAKALNQANRQNKKEKRAKRAADKKKVDKNALANPAKPMESSGMSSTLKILMYIYMIY